MATPRIKDLPRIKDFRKSAATAIVAATFIFGSAASAEDASSTAKDNALSSSTESASSITNPKNDAVAGIRAMNKYSLDSKMQGIGIFINLQANAAGMGDDFGKDLVDGFAGLGKDAENAEYRLNQSRGTATIITFHLRGVPYEVSLDELQDKIPNILALQQGAWLPERTLDNNKPAVIIAVASLDP